MISENKKTNKTLCDQIYKYISLGKMMKYKGNVNNQSSRRTMKENYHAHVNYKLLLFNSISINYCGKFFVCLKSAINL